MQRVHPGLKTIAPRLRRLLVSRRGEKEGRGGEGGGGERKTHLHCARFRQREFGRATAGRRRRRIRTGSFIGLAGRGGASTSKRGTISCALSDREARRRVTTSPLIIMPSRNRCITSRCSIFTRPITARTRYGRSPLERRRPPCVRRYLRIETRGHRRLPTDSSSQRALASGIALHVARAMPLAAARKRSALLARGSSFDPARAGYTRRSVYRPPGNPLPLAR